MFEMKCLRYVRMSECASDCVCVCMCTRARENITRLYYFERIPIEGHVHIVARFQKARDQQLLIRSEVRLPLWIARFAHLNPFVVQLLNALLALFWR